MDLNWGRPVAATDGWLGVLDGAVLAADTRKLTHLIVRRGLVLPRRLAVPAQHLQSVDEYGLYLDLSIIQALGLPPPARLADAPGAMTLDRRARVLLKDGSRLVLKGLRLPDKDHAPTHCIVKGPGLAASSVVLSMDRATSVGSGQIATDLGPAEARRLPRYRLDADIQADAWEALYSHKSIPDVDLSAIQLQVTSGTVALSGHVRMPATAKEIERVVSAVEGVISVQDGLVSDRQLELDLASAIAGRVPGHSGNVIVRSYLGAVVLEGYVPSEEVRDSVLEAVRLLRGPRQLDCRLQVRQAPSAPAPEAQAVPAEVGGKPAAV